MGRHSKRKEHRVGTVWPQTARSFETVQCVCGSHECRWAAYSTPFRWRGMEREWRRQSWGTKARRQGAKRARVA